MRAVCLLMVAICVSTGRPALAAADLVVDVGPPVAAMGQQKKGNVFVVRPGGCADPATAQFTGTAEGVVNGIRQSLPLRLAALQPAGVHGVPQAWPAQGVWVISVAAACDGKTAGAIVSLGATPTFRRDGVHLLPRTPTPSDIDASLRRLAAF